MSDEHVIEPFIRYVEAERGKSAELAEEHERRSRAHADMSTEIAEHAAALKELIARLRSLSDADKSNFGSVQPFLRHDEFTPADRVARMIATLGTEDQDSDLVSKILAALHSDYQETLR